MDSNRWQRIEELFHAASQLPAEDRAAFLKSECAGDEVVLQEVESLIGASDDGHAFIDQPALSLGMRVLSTGQKESQVGQSIGHYKIVQLLGEGGMGTVYLAEDCTLERRVALKFLAPGLVDDHWAREQLMKEARAVARLENPNICAVYGLEEIGDHNFIVMQYVEGETLASLLRKGRLNPERALEFAEQIAGALAAAHVREIIHRDVKPQNIVITLAGQAKILDFGLAKFVRRSQSMTLARKIDHTSQTGLVIGTVAYMSPEQTRGDELDCRSDVFSFGILLHEMLSGKNPFRRATIEESIAAIRTEAPARLSAELPSELMRISRKCLEKELECRYETAEQLLLDLSRLRKSREHATIMGWRRYLQYYAAAALILLTLLLAGAGYGYLRATIVHSLAVVPILNESGEPDKKYLTDGLTRSLFDRFSYLPRLKVKMPTELASRQIEQIVQEGRDLKVEALLVGDVIKQDDKLLLRMRLVNTANGAVNWDQTFPLDSANTFSMQDEITGKVTSTLGMWLFGSDKKLLTRHQTDNQEALTAYMRGQYYWNLKRGRETTPTAIKFFDQAIDLDPSFAEAYAGRADCYVMMSNVLYGPLTTAEAMEKATYNARKAIEINPLLAEAHTSMGTINLRYNWDWKEAEREFRLAIDINPDYAPAHFYYSILLSVLGRFDESISESEKGRSLDPDSPAAAVNYGRALYLARRFDEAERFFRKLLADKPDYSQYLHPMGWVLLQQGRTDEAISKLEKLYAKDPLHAAAALGYAYGRVGRKQEAERILLFLEQSHDPIPPHEKALVYIGMRDWDNAFLFLQKSCDQRFASVITLTTDPIYDVLRADPRFVQLARGANLMP